MTLTPLRFVAIGGELMDVTVPSSPRPMSLAEAQRKIDAWWEDGRHYTRIGDFRRASEVRRQVNRLRRAMWNAEDQQSRQDAKEVVRRMLSDSLEGGHAA